MLEGAFERQSGRPKRRQGVWDGFFTSDSEELLAIDDHSRQNVLSITPEVWSEPAISLWSPLRANHRRTLAPELRGRWWGSRDRNGENDGEKQAENPDSRGPARDVRDGADDAGHSQDGDRPVASVSVR